MGSRERARRSARPLARRPISVSSAVASRAVCWAPGDAGAEVGGAGSGAGDDSRLRVRSAAWVRAAAGLARTGLARAVLARAVLARAVLAVGLFAAGSAPAACVAAAGAGASVVAAGAARLSLRRCGRVLGSDPITPG